jgi:lipopolysaccharide transport system ATP-binding protein
LSAAIRFEHVTKRFSLERGRPRAFKEVFVDLFRRRERTQETLMALDEVSFDLDRGGSLGLVGPNGTGKSTVLKLIARILEPTAGRVWVDGRVAALLELGAGFHPDLSGRENVYLNGSMMGFSQRQMAGRLERIADFSELGRFIDAPVKHYSSGMYMRLGFATAIHLDADVLLIDEVLAVGDQAFQAKCRDRIADLRKGGVGIVLVSHDNGAIRDLCSHALWLENGKARAYGETDPVIEAYYASMVAREEARFAVEHGEAVESAATEGPTRDRWGSGEVEITGVETLAADGTTHHILTTGEPAIFRIHYLAHVPIEAPVFGLAIHRNDGLHVNGPNTRDGGLKIDAIHGPGTIDYRIDQLALMPATYELSVSCYDQSCHHAYDYHHRRFPFRVRVGGIAEQFGLLYMPSHWSHTAGEAVTAGGATLASRDVATPADEEATLAL